MRYAIEIRTIDSLQTKNTNKRKKCEKDTWSYMPSSLLFPPFRYWFEEVSIRFEGLGHSWWLGAGPLIHSGHIAGETHRGRRHPGRNRGRRRVHHSGWIVEHPGRGWNHYRMKERRMGNIINCKRRTEWGMEEIGWSSILGNGTECEIGRGSVLREWGNKEGIGDGIGDRRRRLGQRRDGHWKGRMIGKETPNGRHLGTLLLLT